MDKLLTPKEMVKCSVGYLRQDMTLTNKWGVDFIKSSIKIIKEEKRFSLKQIENIKKQYNIIKKNAEKKGLVI